MNKFRIIIFILFLVLLTSCQAQSVTEAPEIPLIPTQLNRVLINEVLAGAEDNNQADFIELYNANSEITDLNGYSLWYQLKDGSEEILLYQWNEVTLIPPLGYYALVLDGQDFGVIPDGLFNQPLVPNRGALSLRNGDQIEDQLAWGTGPIKYAEGSLVDALEPGSSIERIFDPDSGFPIDSNNNQADFSLNSSPSLMNTGSSVNFPVAEDLDYLVNIPEVIRPGEEFTIEIMVKNRTGHLLNNLQFSIKLPEYLTYSGDTLDDNTLVYTIPELSDGEDQNIQLDLQADYTFADINIHSSYLKAENWPLPAFNGPYFGKIGGGPIPISTARTLIDKEVVVEGISTMYVGGFYAGSGAKFYVEDESGGIQVYVSGAGASLVVPLGSTVQVKGKIEIYRDSIELIPTSEALVQIIADPAESPEMLPELVDIADVSLQGDSYTGKLITVEGRVARIEEFSYSYEIDLYDEVGNLVPLYIDKNTGITLEEVESNHFYRITGIMEIFDGNLQLYPRLQSDLKRIYEPGLAIQVHPPTTANPDESFEVIYTVINHAQEPDQNLVISAKIDPALEILEVLDQGRMSNNTIVWDMDKLDGNGEQVSVSFLAKLPADSDFIVFDDYRVISSSWPESQYGLPSYTFSGESVPIWAIQGSSYRSAYNLKKLTTQGVVTGIFPDLEGFWIQEKESDDDPNTSSGLFVRTGPSLPEISLGDQVSVTGRVRESFQQTELELFSPTSLSVIGNTSLPEAIELDPPMDNTASLQYYEALEGVLVSVPGPANVVSPTTRYGEFAMVLSELEIERSWQDQDHGMLIHVDDGTTFTHENRDTMSVAVSVGDKVFQVVGPLAYTYGNYKVEPIQEYQVQATSPEISQLDPLGEGYFSIMTWNVENLFDFLVPHPSSPSLPKVSEYKRDISKVARTIQAAGYPTVIGFQEVETIEILEDIAVEPILLDYDYQAVLIEGTDSRGIDVGYLIRGDTASIIDQVQYPAPGNITSRPPLLVEVQIGQDTLFVLNNHFTSMSGGEEATEPRRNAQAAWNLEIALELLDENPNALVAIIGDLNSYYGSLPIQTIQNGGFQNLFDNLEPEERYTYIYQGNSQVLDHILVNSSLEALLIDFLVLHSNADFSLPYSTDESIIHKSDHDPVIAIFVRP